MILLGQMIPSLLQSKPTITPIINRWRLLAGALCLETALIAYGCLPLLVDKSLPTRLKATPLQLIVLYLKEEKIR